MSEDDERARQRLLALEREVRAEAEAKAARKAEALERVRAERARQEAERQALRDRQAELVGRRARPADEPAREREGDADADADDRLAGVGRGLELARRADDVRQELSRPRAANEKSWAISAGASFLLGPLGWLYAGSWREAIPASAAYLAAAMILRILPTFLLMPVMMVAMPASALAGLLYALRYNRNGRRMRLFGPDAPPKQLASGGGKGGGKALPPGKPRR